MTLADEHWNERTDHLGLGLSLQGIRLHVAHVHVVHEVLLLTCHVHYIKRTLLPFKGEIY